MIRLIMRMRLRLNEIKIDKKIVDGSKNKLISNYGKIEGIQIVNAEFAKRIKYVQICSDGDKQALGKIKEIIDTTGETTYLSAYVEVGDKDKVKLRCFIHCTNANML